MNGNERLILSVWDESDHGRLISKGDLRYIVLSAIRDRPRHGYDLIRLIERRLDGLYSPSAGAIYPMLRSLEGAGLVFQLVRPGKKIYQITDAGLRFLAENQEAVEEIESHLSGWLDSKTRAGLRAVHEDLRAFHRTFGRENGANWTDPAKLARARAAIAKAAAEIERILAGDASAEQEPALRAKR